MASLLVVTAALRLTVERGAAMHAGRVAGGVAVAIGGLALTLSAAKHFAREKANIVTFNEPTRLIEGGWYRITRNPMYLGFVLLLGGTALALGGAWTFVPTGVFLLVAEVVYIPFEERAMTRMFGDAYRQYTRRVRRWFGRRR